MHNSCTLKNPVQLPQDEAKRMHAENLSHPPNIPNKTILLRVVADSILPVTQKDRFKVSLEQYMRDRDEYKEKVVFLSVEDPNDQAEFLRELEQVKAEAEEQYKGYTIQFDVACPSKELVGMVQDKYKNDIQALAFTKEGDGDIIQVESIILALHVLRTGKIDDLFKVYKLLTGKEFKTDKPVESIRELAKSMLFELPVISILDINECNRLNALQEENIKQAA